MNGGCHHALDADVVYPEVKRDLVDLIRAAGWTVVAAGDSPIDLEMLVASDRALFVADHKGSPGLRALLHRMSGVRLLAVDVRRFDGVPVRTAEAIVRMVRPGGDWNAV